MVGSAAELWAKSDIVFKVRGPSNEEVGLMREGGTLVSFIWPAQNPDLMQQLASRKVTVLAMDALPRMLSRAQKMLQRFALFHQRLKISANENQRCVR